MNQLPQDTPSCAIGILGLGLLSRNLILAVTRGGFPVACYDADQRLASEFRKQAHGLPVTVCDTLEKLTGHLRPPRTILIIVQSGPYLEELFRDLGEHLAEGDLLIDCASYHYRFTPRKRRFFAEHGVHFLTVGIAASVHRHQYGCRVLYPGFQETCRQLRPLFEHAATTATEEPCVTFIGRQIAQQLQRLEKEPQPAAMAATAQHPDQEAA